MRSIHTSECRVQTNINPFSPPEAESFDVTQAAWPLLLPKHSKDVLTINEVADILRCSRNHLSNVMNGKVPGCRCYPIS
jgi:hypothetical protein